jgi:hypothetical protein
MYPFTEANFRSMMRQQALVCRIQRYFNLLFDRNRRYKMQNNRATLVQPSREFAV